jgi:hypothetical protein
VPQARNPFSRSKLTRFGNHPTRVFLRLGDSKPRRQQIEKGAGGATRSVAGSGVGGPHPKGPTTQRPSRWGASPRPARRRGFTAPSALPRFARAVGLHGLRPLCGLRPLRLESLLAPLGHLTLGGTQSWVASEPPGASARASGCERARAKASVCVWEQDRVEQDRTSLALFSLALVARRSSLVSRARACARLTRPPTPTPLAPALLVHPSA